jgi:hypothetical protein
MCAGISPPLQQNRLMLMNQALSRYRSEDLFGHTGTCGRCQISRAYSWIVRSLENLPTRAVFMIAIFAQRAFSR